LGKIIYSFAISLSGGVVSQGHSPCITRLKAQGLLSRPQSSKATLITTAEIASK